MNQTIEQMLESIDSANRKQAKQFWADLQQHVPKAAGSGKSHQAWEYGYRDHIQEVMNLAYILHERLTQERPLGFSLSSALLVLFLHDCEKPFKEAATEELAAFPWITQKPAKSDKTFQKLLLNQYQFELTEAEQNGLKYVEGENEDYIEGERLQGPLASFCHVCDNISARIWHDYPRDSA